MKKTKKSISLLLSILMIITSLPMMAVSSFAADETASDFEYNISTENLIEITSYKGSATDLTIPSKIDGYTVAGLGDGAFEGCTSLVSVKIPDTVEYINFNVFCGCSALKSIEVDANNSEYSSENGVLFNKNKDTIVAYPMGKEDTSYVVPDGVLEIGMSAFHSCSKLTNVKLPDGVEIIDDFAFAFCYGLESIIVPDSVRYLGDAAFLFCIKLESVTLGNGIAYIGNTVFSYSDFYNNESNWENDGLYIGKYLLNVSENVGKDFWVKGGTEVIADCAFSSCEKLVSVMLPETITSIGETLFYECPLIENIVVNGNGGVYSSEYGVLYKGNSLAVYPQGKADVKFNIPAGTDSICDYAFLGNKNLKNVILPDSVKAIGNGAFSGCSALTSVTIGENVKSIGIYAFFNCLSLKSIKLSDTTTEIGDSAFGYYYENDTFKTVDGFTIYGNKGSEAERYANENGFSFVQAAPAPTMSFPDVTDGDWYYDAVKYNFERGYITGYSNGTFGPSNNIQRQDFVLILARIAGADLSAYEGQNGGFSDVPTNAYYSAAVAWAKDKGIVTGYSADNFGVGTYITREQISLILCRYLNGSVSGDVDAILNAYSDGGNTSPWAKAGVAWAVENGIIGNSDYLNPNGNAGRAEVAQIIYNMSNKGML